MTDLRIVVTNDSPDGGTYLTPFWYGFHDGSFDLFDTGSAASAGLEAIAEDGNFAPIDVELLAADADGQGNIIPGAAGPIETGETTSTIVTVDGASNGELSLAAMILPSNDAFVGTNQALVLFDEDGNFLGETTRVFTGENVYDAGTEVNTEEDAAFLNQTAPNTGVDENGVIRLHDGFNGSLDNPVGEGAQNILGGTNAFGDFIDPVIADFTQPGAEIATVHINTVNVDSGGADADTLLGRGDDDIFAGMRGNDELRGRNGWDELDGGNGNDDIFGGRGNDILKGGNGNDELTGGQGNDTFYGGAGDDLIFLGQGDNRVNFGDGDGNDTVARINDGDLIHLNVDGIETLEDVIAAASEDGPRTVLDFGDGDSLTLRNTAISDLSDDLFLFG